jgi:PPOX class probable F420-dependent enzyme
MTFDPETHAEALRLMETEIVAWLTTVTPAGMPQSSVICFLWDGETILTFSEPDKPKMRNIAANPKVSFHLNCDPYGMHMVSIEGIAAIDDAVPPSDEHDAWMDKHRDPYRHWGMDPVETASTWNAALRITPTRIRVW